MVVEKLKCEVEIGYCYEVKLFENKTFVDIYELTQQKGTIPSTIKPFRDIDEQSYTVKTEIKENKILVFFESKEDTLPDIKSFDLESIPETIIGFKGSTRYLILNKKREINFDIHNIDKK